MKRRKMCFCVCLCMSKKNEAIDVEYLLEKKKRKTLCEGGYSRGKNEV